MSEIAQVQPHHEGGRIFPHFAIDLRALVAFRIGVGVLILVDLFNRFRFLTVHYTDEGILPRAEVIAAQGRFDYSFHMLSGEGWVVALLFLVNALLALLLLVGFRTRLVTFVLWIFMVSLHTRAPELLQSGDTILKLYLLWGIFLPLGAGWSIDRAMDQSEVPVPQTFNSWATVGILVQILAVYFFAAMIKAHPAWLSDGRAVQYALMIEQVTRPWVVFLLPFDLLLRLATWGTMVIELFGPLLLLLGVGGWRWRAALVFVFLSLHLSFVALMDLGQFPFISMVGWLLFVPQEVFDALSRRLPKERGEGITIWYDGTCGFCRKVVHLLRTFLMLGQAKIEPAQGNDMARSILLSRNSWAVSSGDGRILDRFDALLHLVRTSPLTGLLVPAQTSRLSKKFGDACYRWIAGHRRLGGSLLLPIRFRPARWQLGDLGEAAAGVLIAYVVIWNLATVGSASAFPYPWRIPGEILSIEQRWRMFAPYPLTRSGQVYGIAVLADSTEVLLAPDGRNPRPAELPLSGEPSGSGRPPEGEDEQVDRIRMTRLTAPSQRWRKYHENVSREAELAQSYARFLCRDYLVHRGDRPAADRMRVVMEYSEVQHESPPRWSDRISETLAEVPCAAEGG